MTDGISTDCSLLLAPWASSSSSQEDCRTEMRARHQNRKSIVCKQSPLLKISPATFYINTNQISPINLLQLISLSTSAAPASHLQLKLPYGQMYINNFPPPPTSILHCSKPTHGTALAGLPPPHLCSLVNSLKWDSGALPLPGFHRALCEQQPGRAWAPVQELLWALLPSLHSAGTCRHGCTAGLDVPPLAVFSNVFK